MTKVVYYVLSVDTYKQQYVVFKGVLQSPRLKHHVNTIGIDQPLSKNALFEHKCLKNINKLYKHAGKCDYQQQFEYILQDAMFSTPKVFTSNSPRYPMTPTPVNKPSDITSLCLFTNILYMKKNFYPSSRSL